MPNSKFTFTFDILDSLPIHILLGMDFMVENSFELNLKQNTIIINGQELEIIPEEEIEYLFQKKKAQENELYATEGNNTPTPEKEILNKVNSIKPTDEALRVIEGIKKNNPPLGTIKETEHSIPLKGDVMIKRKPFKVPYKYIDIMKREINRLIENDIIKESGSISLVLPLFY